jgi:thioredoxin-like negative regulator of GroEL
VILERAHRLHPRNYRLLSTLIDCNMLLKRDAEVERLLHDLREMLVEIVDHEPENYDARIILAINLAQLGENAAGIAQADRAIASAPEDGRVRYNAACTFAHAGEVDRALEQLRILRKLTPTHPTDWILRDPDLAALHEHPEFVALFGRNG